MQVCVLTVALLWGSYSPAVRLVYSQPGPPVPEVLTAVRALLQAGVLLLTSVALPLLLTRPQEAASGRDSKGAYTRYDSHCTCSSVRHAF